MKVTELPLMMSLDGCTDNMTFLGASDLEETKNFIHRDQQMNLVKVEIVYSLFFILTVAQTIQTSMHVQFLFIFTSVQLFINKGTIFAANQNLTFFIFLCLFLY